MMRIKKVIPFLICIIFLPIFAALKTINKIEFVGNGRTEESVLNLIVEMF